jgi:AmmeMemoRadiSam system protein B
MARAPSRPALRAVEAIVVPDAEHGRVLVLRDTKGVTTAQAAIPPALIPVVARFSGELTCREIAAEVSAEIGQAIPVALVERLAADLDEALFLEGPTYRAALDQVKAEFHDGPVRAASHAGGAYTASAAELVSYLEDRCLARATPPPARAAKSVAALIAPHIDPWRGAFGYGQAYGALRRGLAEEADTFVVFGTSHAPMTQPFALCRKAFATPLGAMEADLEAIDRIAARCSYDPYADELNHKREHSIEFQVVFLKHLLGDRPARIVPILAGLGRHQGRGTDPGEDPSAMALLDAVRDLVAERGRRVVVVAGADMAHVGPRFGDAAPLGEAQRSELRRIDGVSIELAARRDARGFWFDVARDLDTRRVCGLSPIYALLQTAREGATGEALHYEQTIDPEEGSIVSHAAVAFWA